MEHILQFAINIDDEAIKKTISEKAEKQIIENITISVQNKIQDAIYNSGYYHRDDKLKGWVKDEFNKFLDANKDEIISIATEKLADRLSRTKRVREAVDEVLKNYD